MEVYNKVMEMFLMSSLLLLSIARISLQIPNCDLKNYQLKNLTLKSWNSAAKNKTLVPFRTEGFKVESCQYFISFCKPVTVHVAEDNTTCNEVGACLQCIVTFKKTQILALRSLGKFESSTVSPDDSGVLVSYKSGTNVKKGCNVTTRIKLTCNPKMSWNLADADEQPVPFPSTQESFNSDNCTLDLTFPFAGACVTSSSNDDSSSSTKHGLSPGSILLIIFFVGLLIYLIGGMAFNFTHGVMGVELIPQYEFWREFPGYVVDGVTFFFKLVTCQPTQKDSYDSI